MEAPSNTSRSSCIQEIVAQLKTTIADIDVLVGLLCAPLDRLLLLPPLFLRYNSSPIPHDETVDMNRDIPALQYVILESIVITWLPSLQEQRLDTILDQYFCPDLFSSASQSAGEVALHAYATLLSSQMSAFSIRQLENLARSYPIDRLYGAIFSPQSTIKSRRKISAWEDCIRDVTSVAAKVANSVDDLKAIPEELHYGTYLSKLSTRVEAMMIKLCTNKGQDHVSSVGTLVIKLVNIGLFPSFKTTLPSQPSFFAINIAMIRMRLDSVENSSSECYSKFWTSVVETLPSKTLTSLVKSLLVETAEIPDPLDTSLESRGLVKREGILLSKLLGQFDGEEDEKWVVISSLMAEERWNERHSRILICWTSGCKSDDLETPALEILLSKVIDVWTDTGHIKHSLLSQHRYMTSLLLITVSYLPSNSAFVQELSFSPAFISSIGTYIGHSDVSIRRCGMLVAEVLAQRAGKSLDFGDWDGDNDTLTWARKLRSLITGRDIDAEAASHDVVRLEYNEDAEPQPVAPDSDDEAEATSQESRQRAHMRRTTVDYDSDDSLTGYASPALSSRTPSPTPSEYEELEKDPTLRIGKKKIQKPVYLMDLGEMIRSNTKPDDAEEADRIEIALSCAEELIRRKKNYGLELEENAVNLVFGLIGLHNNFELPKFEADRQAALNALVACCPRKAAPTIVQEFFKNQYSTVQRLVMLNALVYGARELASLPIPNHTATKALEFPSRKLPPALHRRYLTQEQHSNALQPLLDTISQSAIDSSGRVVGNQLPEIVRERQLRIKRPSKISEITSHHRQQNTGDFPSGQVKFTEVAAEYFIGPLVNAFWLFLRDEQAREERTAYRQSSGYQGTGVGLILSPQVLSHFMSTLAILMDAARHSPPYLAVLAPNALELAVTIGTRPMSRTEIDDGGEDSSRQATLLTTSFELALTVLDACLSLDGGRSLALENTSLLLGAAEWAERILTLLEKGIKMVDGGGVVQGARLKRSAAGVVLKIDEITTRWRRSMIAM